MNMKTKTGPLFKNVDELHLALVDYAKQALAQSLKSKTPGLWHEESIGGDPVFILSETKLTEIFADDAKERLAQVAQSAWLDQSSEIDDAHERGVRFGIEFVLKSLAHPRTGGPKILTDAIDAVLAGTIDGIREELTPELVRRLAGTLRSER